MRFFRKVNPLMGTVNVTKECPGSMSDVKLFTSALISSRGADEKKEMDPDTDL
jgi:hypothetical protein